MVVSEIQILIALQLFLVLLGANFFFLLNYRRQGSFVDRLKQRVKELVEAEPPPAPTVISKNVINSSMELVGFDLEQAIDETIKHFDELGVPVIPELKADLAQFQIALLLRLNILQLEKAALEFPTDSPKRKWQFLEAKLADMVAKLKAKPRYREIAQEGNRDEVVSAFNETLGVLQPEWIQYQQETGQLHPDLINIIIQSNDSQGVSSWAGMLHSQAKAGDENSDFALNFELEPAVDFSAMMGDSSATTDMLTNIAKEQAQVISGLKQKLAQLESMDVDVSEYTEQIDRFDRLMKESETVVKMLERELDDATQKIHELEVQVANAETNDMESNADSEVLYGDEPEPEAVAEEGNSALKEAQSLILKFAQDSMMYLKAINKLEKDNAALSAENVRLQGSSEMSDGGSEMDSHLLSRMAELEWEYVELERRFLTTYDTLKRLQKSAAMAE